MSGGSLCKVEVVKFPAGINHKLLFIITTMKNTIHDIYACRKLHWAEQAGKDLALAAFTLA